MVDSDEQQSPNQIYQSTAGKLLGHGMFNIHQVRNSLGVLYMTCGSVEYPLMKRTRILKVNRDSFILPLFNPERYWKISLFTDDYRVIHDLEKVFAMTCQFHDFTNDQFSDQRDYIQERTTTPTKELRNDQEKFEREDDCGNDTLLVPLSCEGKESPIDMIADGSQIEQDLEGGNAHVVDLDSTQEMQNLLSTSPLENFDSRNSNQELIMPDLEPPVSSSLVLKGNFIQLIPMKFMVLNTTKGLLVFRTLLMILYCRNIFQN
ncbi:unnamed protein product [Ambrosiozyma monospora]|uniref:Unnamed protein product n=1 Tax=Ambrosiozyma monospora TaxID=43982 RepID=A0ACB5TU93_AMBMO|nr:unnamed protein product [Ambrosiozyma monospora]